MRHSYHHRLGPKRAVALIGWYMFKGSDNTGSFATKALKSQFGAFLASDDAIFIFGNKNVVPDDTYKHLSPVSTD